MIVSALFMAVSAFLASPESVKMLRPEQTLLQVAATLYPFPPSFSFVFLCLGSMVEVRCYTTKFWGAGAA